MTHAVQTAPAVEDPRPAQTIGEISDATWNTDGTRKPRPIVTWRVTIRATSVALRRTENIDLPAFGQPALYRDQLCEFPSESTAQLAAEYVWMRTNFGRTLHRDQVVTEPMVWAGLTNDQENALLCRVRDTMVWLGHVEAIDYLTNARRGMVGVEPRRAS